LSANELLTSQVLSLTQQIFELQIENSFKLKNSEPNQSNITGTEKRKSNDIGRDSYETPRISRRSFGISIERERISVEGIRLCFVIQIGQWL